MFQGVGERGDIDNVYTGMLEEMDEKAKVGRKMWALYSRQSA